MADAAAPSPRGACIQRVIFFDIDGTLVRSIGNTTHDEAFAHALRVVAGVEASIDELPHHGMTDMWILRLLLEKRGWEGPAIAAAMPALKAAMVEFYVANAGRAGVEVLPGVSALLAALGSREDTLLGLVTGNLEAIGRTKLAASGLCVDVFSVGGFGSDTEVRGEMIKLGLRRAGEAVPGLRERLQACGWLSAEGEEGSVTSKLEGGLLSHEPAAGGAGATPAAAPAPRDGEPEIVVYHCGDTLYDLKAATYAGARGIGVATGKFSLDVLAGEPSYALLPDFSDTRAVLQLFGIKE